MADQAGRCATGWPRGDDAGDVAAFLHDWIDDHFGVAPAGVAGLTGEAVRWWRHRG